MNIKDKLKQYPFVKKLVLWLLFPKGQARPRWWVKKMVLPFTIEKGKGALIRKRIRFDVVPFNAFTIGKNSTIEDFCTINNGVGDIYIDEETRIGIGSVLIGPITIGKHVRLAQNVVISALNHNYEDVSKPISQQGVSTNEVEVGDETWIGANVTILPGCNIGKHCVVAAGSIVTKSIPSYSVAAGNPARIIKTYNIITRTWEKVHAPSNHFLTNNNMINN